MSLIIDDPRTQALAAASASLARRCWTPPVGVR
jgi:hypothetical protein